MNRPRTCPRCSECADGEDRHHWIDDGDSLTGVACKHCPAVAVECDACGGTGEGESFDEDGKPVPLGDGKIADCRHCDGLGYAEVVKISLEEIAEWLQKGAAR